MKKDDFGRRLYRGFEVNGHPKHGGYVIRKFDGSGVSAPCGWHASNTLKECRQRIDIYLDKH